MLQPAAKRPKLDTTLNGEGMASPFDVLPNELIELTIKMAMGNMNTQERHDFLVKVIAKVSLKQYRRHQVHVEGFLTF